MMKFFDSRKERQLFSSLGHFSQVTEEWER